MEHWREHSVHLGVPGYVGDNSGSPDEKSGSTDDKSGSANDKPGST
jgi:hypothetical protein